MSVLTEFGLEADLEMLASLNPYRRVTMSNGHGFNALLTLRCGKPPREAVLYFSGQVEAAIIPDLILHYAAAEAALVGQVLSVDEWMQRTKNTNRGDARLTHSFAIAQAKRLQELLGAKEFKRFVETLGTAQMPVLFSWKPAQSAPAARGATLVATRRGRPPKAAAKGQMAAVGRQAVAKAASEPQHTAATVPLERFVSVKPVVDKPPSPPPPAPGAAHDQPAAGRKPPTTTSAPAPLAADGPDYGLFQ